jgi:hypothetical protein
MCASMAGLDASLILQFHQRVHTLTCISFARAGPVCNVSVRGRNDLAVTGCVNPVRSEEARKARKVV